MRKVLFIGIDALDAVQVERFAPLMPNLSRLRETGFYAQFPSVWPPDSETAWASIYTGWNPARHGIFRFVDPLEKTANYIARERDNTIFQGHTFWDLAGAAGRKVCVLFPHIGYPSWAVNGMMVTRASTDAAISLTPAEMAEQYPLQELHDIKGLAGRERAAYLDANRRLVERQLTFNLQVLREQPWELCFTYWSALDLIQHQFWAYCDPQDPTYPGETPFRHAIRDFYVLHDQVIGMLVSAVGPETDILLMSDHGHGMRPVRIFNINRLLREHGFLTLKHKAGHKGLGLLKQVRDRATDFISRHELGSLASKVIKHLPWSKKLYVAAADLDFEQTVAYITDMSGIKAYSYGGIRIVRENLKGRSYEAVRSEIIALLQEARTPDAESRPLVRWIKPREELYAGPYLDEYPDLVFELDPEYGAGWDAAGPLFDVSASHKLYSGSHLQANAVFLLHGPAAARVDRAPSSMMDIAPTVLDLLDVPVPEGLDGRSVLRTKPIQPTEESGDSYGQQ